MQAARAAERSQKAQLREQERQARQSARMLCERHRLDKRSYQEARAAEVDEDDLSLAATVEALETLLQDALARPVGMNWSSLERKVSEADLGEMPFPPSREVFRPKPPGILQRITPGLEKTISSASCGSRRSLLVCIRAALFDRNKVRGKISWSSYREEAHKHNRKINEFREGYRSGKPKSVEAFFTTIFENVDYPDNFPNRWQLRYAPESRHLIVNFNLPTIDDIIPPVERYKYIKSSDAIIEINRTEKARQTFYEVVVSQAVLRRLYEVFVSDREELVDVVTVSAFVEAIDPSTGQQVGPCLVSVRTTRNEFEKLTFGVLIPKLV